MNGVEILNEKVVYVREINLTAFWIVFGVIMIGLTIYAIYSCWSGEIGVGGLIGALLLALVVASIMGLLIGEVFGHYTEEILYVEQKVIIDDSVPMNKFYEHYDVVAQEGKIYTVRPKNNEPSTN